MNCQWLAGSIGKPLLVAIQQELTDKEIQALWEAGVNGVVVEVREKTQQRLVKLCQAVKTLPPVTRKPRERSVVLPRLGEEAGSVTPEEI
jgi:Tfp pilus assembly PilM family ATPase